ncbi:hypothetical protein RHSIM_Rhsim03G0119700 [Rhododendron simsii]|uniref:Uncharacterized protein n=1 Tax=Rhododendron simsii TaxID=118357 RepID=A0A834HIP1_RHOSS|nr:hypothetical protein RHSIM_Rhsim03G0119700 [Rhododendron simsii]
MCPTITRMNFKAKHCKVTGTTLAGTYKCVDQNTSMFNFFFLSQLRIITYDVAHYALCLFLILSSLFPLGLSDYKDHKNLTKLSEKYIVALPSISQDPPPPLNFIVYLILCSQT